MYEIKITCLDTGKTESAVFPLCDIQDIKTVCAQSCNLSTPAALYDLLDSVGV